MRRSTWLWLVCCLTLVSCVKESESHSELFRKIFLEKDSGLFRGVEMGWTMDHIKETEATTPKHDDKFGLIYEFRETEKEWFAIEYICKDQDKRSLVSIVVNVFMDEQQKATELYNEITVDFRKRFGVGEDLSGKIEWVSEELNLYVTLRMLDDHKSLSFNFVPETGF